jgi:isocitrate lyase
VYEEMLAEGDNMTGYDRNNLMEYNMIILSCVIVQMIKLEPFRQMDQEAGIFHLNYLTYVPYHSTAYE